MLDRRSVTRASRIMLPTYVAFFGLMGLNYLISDDGRLLHTPALRYADHVMSLRVWGMLFLVCSVLMAEALLLHRRPLYQGALLVCGVSMTIWTAVNVLAVLQDEASPAGWAWPAFVAMACMATYRSLYAREGSR